jgi:hypothetical protein
VPASVRLGGRDPGLTFGPPPSGQFGGGFAVILASRPVTRAGHKESYGLVTPVVRCYSTPMDELTEAPEICSVATRPRWATAMATLPPWQSSFWKRWIC